MSKKNAKAAWDTAAPEAIENARGFSLVRDELAQRADSERKQVTHLPLDAITDRESDTRELCEAHVDELAHSIALVGLIAGPAVDCKGRILAGGHRVAALKRYSERDPDAFAAAFPKGIPVTMHDVEASGGSKRALEIEVAENEKRRDYTRDEIAKLVVRLRQVGYKDLDGRPRKDEQALRPALALIIGKSVRTVRRLLTDMNSERAEGSKEATSEEATEKGIKLIRRGLDILLDANCEGIEILRDHVLAWAVGIEKLSIRRK